MRTAPLYDAATTRTLDRAAIEQGGIPGLALMQRAGRAAFDALRRRWPAARRIVVLSGTGNNGGDGFVVAGLARSAGFDVTLHVIGDHARIDGDARSCFEAARADGVEPAPAGTPSASDLATADVLVDALLGIGLDRDLAGEHAAVVDALNRAARPVLALDVPTGLHADTGQVLGDAVRADATVTFIALKQGLLTGEGPAVCGALELADLDVPGDCLAGIEAGALALDYAGACEDFPPRRPSAHKGDFGHVLVIGGAPGFAGAARMAAEAAARSGAGLVSLATHPDHAALIAATRPEIMCHGLEDARTLRRLAARASVVAIGPGLGQGAWSRELFAAARELRGPQVLDADALNLLAADPEPREERVLTPHPGEAARLLGTTTAEVQRDRFDAARRLTARYGGVALLKGAGTIVQAAGCRPLVIRGGNPGMASGGMGDVLTGIVAGLVAQHHALPAAAALAAVVHAEAADCAARRGERGLLAGDVIDCIRAAVNPAP